MNSLEHLLSGVSKDPIAILDSQISIERYTSLDLSDTNPALVTIKITDPSECQKYIDSVLEENRALVAYGGYLEQRNLYNGKANFLTHVNGIRNIHLGIDYWARAGTSILAPLDGYVHSFKNNHAVGDYGPTIILSHTLLGLSFYTLYGHLSLASMSTLKIGHQILKGSVLGYLGTPEINVNYAPHLHFQIIRDLGEYFGDYPGVCTAKEVKYYSDNCPNPNLLIKI